MNYNQIKPFKKITSILFLLFSIQSFVALSSVNNNMDKHEKLSQQSISTRIDSEIALFSEHHVFNGSVLVAKNGKVKTKQSR